MIPFTSLLAIAKEQLVKLVIIILSDYPTVPSDSAMQKKRVKVTIT